MTTPAERIFAAFADLSPEAREVVATALEQEPSPLLTAVGRVITDGDAFGRISVNRALRRARSDEPADLIRRLNDEPPWGVVRQCLLEALCEGET